jgi:glucokinase
MRYVIGVDLGGTNIVAGAVAVDGSAIVGLASEPTRVEDGADGVIGRILSLAGGAIQELAGETAGRPDVVGVGVGAPGPLNRATGVVRVAPNLGWRDVPLRDRISEGLGIPASLDNDANCAVLGEWWQGAGRGVDPLVGITVGTGIGGGIVIDGQLYHGAADVAGEFGHMTIDPTGRRCACGNYGCLEAYASGPAIARRAAEGIAAGYETRLGEMVDGDLDRISAQTVYDAARIGDVYAQEIVRETAGFLGAGIANLVNIFNPSRVLVMGGVTGAGEELFKPLRAEVTRRAFRPAVDVCEILPGELVGMAGVYGAACAFLQQLG